MEDSLAVEVVVPRLSLWAKQLILEWREDVIVSSDLSRVANRAGWHSPVDEIVMAMGVIAELYAYGLSGNEASNRSEDELDLDFQDICDGLTAGKPEAIGESGYLYPFPSSGLLVHLYGTTLGVRASHIVDPDLTLASLRDRKSWIDDTLPRTGLDMQNLAAPGAVGRAVANFGERAPLTPHLFFQSAHSLGYEDHRDQAVVGFGTLAHLLTTCTICAGVLDGDTFLPDGRGVAEIYRDLSRWWFDESPSLRFTKQISYEPSKGLPPTPKNTAFALISKRPGKDRSRLTTRNR